jgi:hypothetical protein
MRQGVLMVAVLVFAGATPAVSQTYVKDEDIAKVKVELDSVYDRFAQSSRIGGKQFKTLEGGSNTGNIYFNNDVYFNVVRLVSNGGASLFYVRIGYIGPEWAFLTGTVQFLMDGKDRAEIIGTGELEREVGRCSTAGCVVTEGARIRIPDSLLVRLAKANSVEVRVVGTRQSFERSFKREHHALVRYLVSRYHLAQYVP